MTDVPGLPARRAALKMLDAVLRRSETLDQAAGSAMQHLHSGPDRALARAIAGECLRWLTDLDALVDSATRQVLPDDAKPRAVLRLMLAQWLRLETPPHAVIATALPLLAGGPRRLAHGVFSTLVKRSAQLPDAPSLPAAASVRLGERAPAIATALAAPPPLDLTLRDPATSEAWCQKLGGTSLIPGHVRCHRGKAVESLPGYAEGAWWVQDLAAGLPARLIGRGPGKALDLCAAPGGKTMQLASAGWDVTALDMNAKRMVRLRENLARTRLSADIVEADAMAWEPLERFDAILLDAPCTATGTCRRHPDVLHRIGPRQIAEMAALQARLLQRATGWLKPGGRLVYSVCSLETEEGEEQARGISLATDPVQPHELPDGIVPMREGWLRTEPSDLRISGGLDGFFIARFRA